jgi:hypothetical protein
MDDNNGWLPIETAPKDGTRIMLFVPEMAGYHKFVVGKWEANKYSQKPRPYWSTDAELLWGISTIRARQPSHWRPLPPDPQP